MRATGLDKRLHALTATEMVKLIQAGEASCEAVAQACLAHIEDREPDVQAWQYLNPDRVLAQARALDRQNASTGPLHGVPFGVKDIIDTYDMPTSYGSPIYQGHQPVLDAACVALSRKAGGVLMGKTVTTEFANMHPGKTRHPMDPQRTPGGSSSGSGAAVGDHMVPLAIGTQTTASVIRPASFCGVFGYRPTYGDLRMVGVKEAAGSLDTLGLMARSIDDISLYRDVLLDMEPTPLPPASQAPKIGFCRTPLWSELEPYTASLLEAAAEQLTKVGAHVQEVKLPSDFDSIVEIHRAISSFEFRRNFTYEIENHWEQISLTLRQGRIANGQACSYEQYCDARMWAEARRRQLDDIFASFDVLLTASVAGEAPVGLSSTGNPVFCALWTTMHVPAITVPLFTGPHGLPVGAQLVGRRYRDRQLLAVAQWVSQRLG
ncbi:amidase [Candidatus Entotheonella palauensis]|uniref:amidase n=1 Tax=Candidatus Entotheonella palauensis TaxID=93172 RepID=UPI000B7E37F5|nr:amidase [Candidatus Entotheonella palauensis]